jgi:hypothetical protein
MARQTLRIEGLREARKRVDDVGHRAAAPEPALRSDAVLMALQMGERRKFSTGRFPRDTKAWVDRKRREGLSPKTMQATGRLKSNLENATPPVRRTVFNSSLTWGIRGGRTDLYYARVQAQRGRRAVVIDKLARREVAQRVEDFLATGFHG